MPEAQENQLSIIIEKEDNKKIKVDLFRYRARSLKMFFEFALGDEVKTINIVEVITKMEELRKIIKGEQEIEDIMKFSDNIISEMIEITPVGFATLLDEMSRYFDGLENVSLKTLIKLVENITTLESIGGLGVRPFNHKFKHKGEESDFFEMEANLTRIIRNMLSLIMATEYLEIPPMSYRKSGDYDKLRKALEVLFDKAKVSSSTKRYITYIGAAFRLGRDYQKDNIEIAYVQAATALSVFYREVHMAKNVKLPATPVNSVEDVDDRLVSIFRKMYNSSSIIRDYFSNLSSSEYIVFTLAAYIVQRNEDINSGIVPFFNSEEYKNFVTIVEEVEETGISFFLDEVFNHGETTLKLANLLDIIEHNFTHSPDLLNIGGLTKLALEEGALVSFETNIGSTSPTKIVYMPMNINFKKVLGS